MGWPGHVVDIAYLNESLIKLTDAANLSNLIGPLLTVACTWTGCKLLSKHISFSLFSLSLSPLSRLCCVRRSSGASCHGCHVDVLGVLL